MSRGRRIGVAAGSIAVVAAIVVAVRWPRSDEPRRGSIGPATVVMLGDSITEQGDWQRLIEGVDVANRGYGGYTSEQLVDVAESVARAQPAAVFVLTGTNDIRDAEPPGFTIEHLDRIVGWFDRLAPETEVVLQTVLPRDDTVAEVEAVNAAISELGRRRGLALLDLWVEFDDGRGGLRRSETTDGVHLSEAGYERWAALLARQPAFAATTS